MLAHECGATEEEFSGEAFCVYAENEPGVIFAGATKLPLDSEEVFTLAVRYWCRLLSEVRRIVPDGEWRVHVDDADIGWDERTQSFVPDG